MELGAIKMGAMVWLFEKKKSNLDKIHFPLLVLTIGDVISYNNKHYAACICHEHELHGNHTKYNKSPTQSSKSTIWISFFFFFFFSIQCDLVVRCQDTSHDEFTTQLVLAFMQTLTIKNKSPVFPFLMNAILLVLHWISSLICWCFTTT